MIKIYTVLTFN